METTYKKSDIKKAISDFCESISGGFGYPLNSNWTEKLDEWFDEFDVEKPVQEETIPVTLASIRSICGWSKFCDVTGGNHYALKEYGISDREIFEVKISDAKKLNLI